MLTAMGNKIRYLKFRRGSNARSCIAQNSKPNTLPTELFRPTVTLKRICIPLRVPGHNDLVGWIPVPVRVHGGCGLANHHENDASSYFGKCDSVWLFIYWGLGLESSGFSMWHFSEARRQGFSPGTQVSSPPSSVDGSTENKAQINAI